MSQSFIVHEVPYLVVRKFRPLFVFVVLSLFVLTGNALNFMDSMRGACELHDFFIKVLLLIADIWI